MQEITQGSENNTQENNNETTEKRKPGRPRKSENEELELLKSQLQQLQEENLKLKQIAETIAITNTKNLVECTDDEINSLYVDYITRHETAHDNAIIIQAEDKLIIPKSYYVIG
jgi:thiaminase